jgi:hypothetical protein
MAKGSGMLVKIKTLQRRPGATFEILPEMKLDALNIKTTPGLIARSRAWP